MAESRRRSQGERPAVRRYLGPALLILVLALTAVVGWRSRPRAEGAVVVQSARGQARGPTLLLPDLDQAAPRDLEIQAGVDGTYVLGFRSAVSNVGDGPLVVVGSRPDRTVGTMHADQLIETVSGRLKPVRNVGAIRYVASRGHSHWHYLKFDRYELQSYELRQFDRHGTAVRDRKTGFCLGDRYRVAGLRLPGTPARPVHTGFCGLWKPDRFRVLEGISVGYGDDYSAFLEGQSLPIDGLADGRYLLIHRVNEAGLLHELSDGNNAASVLLALHWRHGAPTIRVLARCPGSARCSPRGG